MSSQSQGQKPNIADFFKPRSQIPQKRPSPSGDSQHASSRPNKARSPTPKTPAVTSRHKHVPVSPFKSPFRPGSASSLPIRSPHPPKPVTQPTYGPGPLFKQQTSPIKSPPVSSSPKSPQQPAFVDVPTTAQSVIKNGKVVAVLDSDGDTDSLESLEDIFGRRKDDSATSASSPLEMDEVKAEVERKKTLSLFTRGRSDPLVGKEKLRALASKERENKFNISRLISDHFDDDEIERNLVKAREGYEASSRESKECQTQGEVDRRLLALVMETKDGEEDDLSRLMSAVERTEAFTSESSFSFFGSQGLTDWTAEAPFDFDFPENIPTGNLWQSGDAHARDKAYLSGFVAEAASIDSVDDSMIAWTFESIVLEPRDALRQAYIRCLEQASVHWTRTNVTASHVQAMFQTLGADTAVLRDSSDIESRPTRRDPGKRDPKYLLSVLELFRVIAHDMDFTALSKLTSLVARLALDVDVMSDGRISLAVEDTISTLLELPASEAKQHIVERLLSDVGSRLKEPNLQAQLLNHILPTSPFAARVRIYLANRFLLGAETEIDVNSEQPTLPLPKLTHYLNNSTFNITTRARHDTVDYAELRATTQLLDIATADGGRRPFESRAEEVAFNREVDALADRTKTIFASIADTGASHMRRTEAKEALQAVQFRLLYAVRTEPRPKKNVFGGRDGDEYRAEERSKGFMASFLAKQREKKALRERGMNEQPPGSPESVRSESERLIRKQLQLSQG